MQSFIKLGLHLALVACTVLALLPTVVRAQKALEPADPTGLALHEVCVAGGLVKVSLGDDANPKTTGHEDCRYCQLGTSIDVPPLMHDRKTAPAQRFLFPKPFRQAPQPLHAWHAPAPRGPPFLS